MSAGQLGSADGAGKVAMRAIRGQVIASRVLNQLNRGTASGDAAHGGLQSLRGDAVAEQAFMRRLQKALEATVARGLLHEAD